MIYGLFVDECFFYTCLCVGIKDDAQIVQLFQRRFKSTTRSKAAVKAKVQKLRTEAVLNFSGITLAEIESSGNNAYSFLRPVWLHNTATDTWLCIHAKAHWADIRVCVLFLI